MKCNKKILHCKELQIYYQRNYQEAYFNEFRNIIKNYDLFFKNIKVISKILI